MYAIRGLLSVLARLMIAAIFLMSAVGNKIPNFNGVVEAMTQQGVPQPKILLGGAIAFLILGSLSIVLGYRARLGAFLLLVFLGAATYYFHDFWTVPAEDADRKRDEMIDFMKNLSLMGTMVFLIANGSGPWSLSGPAAPAAEETAEQVEEEE
ncbi:MAG: DoxX family protein [Planctomycetia bacterium]|nr:DoxX family protein [Planctomycetia bacterium]